MEIIRALQTIKNGFFDVFFVGCTLFGEELLLSAVFAVVFFAVDKKLGQKLGYALFSSACFNSVLKALVKRPRPVGEPWNKPMYTETATGYSFPSGHSQISATAYPILAGKIKRTWAWIVCGIVFFLVGVSRLYLGVHWPTDVLCGWIFGLAFSFGISFLFDKFGCKIGWGVLVFLPFLIFLRADGAFKSTGMFAGFALSMFLEEKFVRFSVDGVPIGKRILRVVCGLAIVAGLKFLLDWLIPAHNLLYFLKYFFIAFTGFFLFPLFFTKCRF